MEVCKNCNRRLDAGEGYTDMRGHRFCSTRCRDALHAEYAEFIDNIVTLEELTSIPTFEEAEVVGG